jgi:hypothetical protein
MLIGPKLATSAAMSWEERMSRVVLLAISVLLLGYCNAQAERGTPQERDACSRDASRLCRKQMADGDSAVQQCLQQRRAQLGRACRKAFEEHGM